MSKLINALKENDIKKAEKIVESDKAIVWESHKTEENETPLHLVSSLKDEKINLFNLLIERGCPWHTIDSKGFTPIHYARKSKHKEIFARLLGFYKKKGLISRESLTGSYVSLTPRGKKGIASWLFLRKGDPDQLSAANVEFVEEQQGEPSCSIDELLSIGNLSINSSNVQEELESFCIGEEGRMILSSNLETIPFIKAPIIDKNNINEYPQLVHEQQLEKEKYEAEKNKLFFHLIESGLFFKSSDIVRNRKVNKKTKKNFITLIKNHSKLNLADKLHDILTQIFIDKEVVESILLHLSPQNAYDIAAGLCQIFDPVDIFDCILKIWPNITNTVKPLCIYFCIPIIIADSHRKNAITFDTNDFSRKMDKFLKLLGNDIIALKDAGQLLKRFYLQTQKSKDVVCDIEVIESHTLRKLSGYELTAALVAEDLVSYHHFLCSQLGVSLEDIKKNQSFKTLEEFESSLMLSARYNQLNFTVVKEILESMLDDNVIQEKNSKIDFYLEVAKNLYHKKEYHFLHAIITSLSSPELSRIPYIQNYLSENQDYEKLKKLFAPERNYKNYRKHIKEFNGLPFWGVILRDLIYLQEIDKNIDFYSKLGKFYEWFNILKWSSQKKVLKLTTDFFYKIGENYPKNNFDNDALWDLSYQIVPRSINLAQLKRINSQKELEREIKKLISNLSIRVSKQIDLEIIDTDARKIGEDAHNALFEYVRKEHEKKKLSYKDSKKIIALSVDLLNQHKHDKESTNLFCYLALLTGDDRDNFIKRDNRLSVSENHLLFSKGMGKQYNEEIKSCEAIAQDDAIVSSELVVKQNVKRNRRLGIKFRRSANRSKLNSTVTEVLPP